MIESPREAMFEARGLSVRYGTRNALADVNLSAREGEFVALVGPNGSGKTTLLRAGLGLVAPSEGSIRLLGNRLEELTVRERARRVAWVPQSETPYDNVPVLDYVRYGRNPHLPRFAGESERDREIVREALESVGMWDRRSDGIHEVSGGERQRVLLARALAQETRVVLLDEPTAHLDVGHQLDLLERVGALCRSGGKCVIAAIHDLNLAARYAHRIVALSRGRVVADGPPRAVLSQALLFEVWGVVADVRADPRSGLPYLLPRLPELAGPLEGTQGASGNGPVHVVGGGGSAAPTLRALTSEGYKVTAGALHLLDTDMETANELDVPVAAEAPFAPLSEEVRVRNRRLLDSARVIVVTGFPVGPSNLANLEDLVPYGTRVPILLLRTDPRLSRDFTGGRASALIDTLRAEGAKEVPDVERLLEELRRILRDRPKVPEGSPTRGSGGREGSDRETRRFGTLEHGEEPR